MPALLKLNTGLNEIYWTLTNDEYADIQQAMDGKGFSGETGRSMLDSLADGVIRIKEKGQLASIFAYALKNPTAVFSIVTDVESKDILRVARVLLADAYDYDVVLKVVGGIASNNTVTLDMDNKTEYYFYKRYLKNKYNPYHWIWTYIEIKD